MKSNMGNKKILIIGAEGMLGQELVKIFRRDKDYKVTAWDKEELDITKERKTRSEIEKLKPDIIINSAAYNAVDKCEDPKEYKKAKLINGKAPGYLAKAAKKIGAVFVHYSSDYVFDGDFSKFLEPAGCTHICQTCVLHKNFTPTPKYPELSSQHIGNKSLVWGLKPVFGYKEDAKPNPISNYGKSKLLGEKEVRKVRGKNYIIRLSKLFGQPGRGNPPAGGAKKSFFDVMLGLGKNPPAGGIKAVDEEISCFTYTPDLAQKTKEIIEAKKPFGIYHITNSGACTWYEAVLELYKQAGLKTKVIPINASEFPRPAKRPAISVLINTKLKPLRSYKEALKEYLEK